MNTIIKSSFADGLLLGKLTFSKTSFFLKTSCPDWNIELSVFICLCLLSSTSCLLVIIFLNSFSCTRKSPSDGSPHCWINGLNSNWLRVSPCAAVSCPLFRLFEMKGKSFSHWFRFNADESTILLIIVLVIRMLISACPQTCDLEGIDHAWKIECVDKYWVNFFPNSGPWSVRAI